MINLLNPKAVIFYITVMPAFIDWSKQLGSYAVAVCIVYVGIATTLHASVVTLANAARLWLADERNSRITRHIFAVLLAGVAFWILATT